jgi:hypothetical protein
VPAARGDVVLLFRTLRGNTKLPAVALYLYHVRRAAPQALGPATIVWSLGFAALATGAMYVLFTLLLRLPAPPGALF